MGTNIKKILSDSLFFRLFIVFFLAWGSLMYSYGNEGMLRLINENSNEVLDVIFKYSTHIGGGIFAIIVVLLLFALKFRWGIIGAISFLGSAGITQVLKRWVFDWDRPREVLENFESLHLAIPMEQLHSSFTFPSGHATSAAAVFCLMSLVFFEKKYLGFVFCFLAIVAAFSRSYLLQHFPADVLVGSLIGAVTSLLVFAWLKDKKFGNWGDKSLFKKAS